MNFNIKIVYDNSLKKNIKELLAYLIKSGYYNSKEKNKCRYDDSKYQDIGDTGITLKTLPYRDSINLSDEKPDKSDCALCNAIQNHKRIEPLSLAKSLLWRGYVIRPNDFPYLKNHLLIMSADHNHGKSDKRGSQNILHMEPNIIKDMLDFYLLLKQNGTMFFNGLAGNSQYHFHFHYIQEPLPIETYINDSVINKQEKYKTISGNDVYLFKTNSLKKCFRGILITGKKETVGKDIFKVLGRIKKKGFEYNVILIKNNSDKNKVTSIIFIRDNSKIKKTDPPLGASIVAGFYTRTDITCSQAKLKKTHQKLVKYCSRIVVTPTKDFISILLK